MTREGNLSLSTGENLNVTPEWFPAKIPRLNQLSWEDFALAVVLCIFIIITVVGNTLVILAVVTTKRLRTVTNCYVMSLAVADWLVGVFVMPPKVAFHLMGSWELGGILCDIWISLDVLCCTASILSLCAISVDRYLAVTQPLNYSRRRRSKKLALLMILIVWLAAITITCPPIFGWYDVDHHKDKTCRYNQNEGYVIFSAMGSFFIPLIVMLYVYARISCVVSKRHDKLRQVQTDSKRSHKFASSNDEFDCMERSCDGDEKCDHHSIIKSTRQGVIRARDCPRDPARDGPRDPARDDQAGLTGKCRFSLSNSDHSVQFTSTSTATASIHQQRSLRSHLCFYHNQNSSNPEICGHGTRLNYYGAGGTTISRSSRSQNITIDLASGDQHSCAKGDHSCGLKYNASSRVSSFRRESKTTQTLTIVVGGFVACWLPFFVTYIMTPFLPDRTIPSLLVAILTWLGWFNSAINPFIYAFYSVDFRTAFWRLTFRHCSRTQKSQQQFGNRNK